MKVSALIIAGASLAAAAPQKVPEDVPINCAQANANYCMDGDIILRCNAQALGIRSRCSADLRGQPPQKGVASCWQSDEEAGDAACAKNCVVYAEEAFTLDADECSPIFVEDPEHPPSNTTPVPTTPSPAPPAPTTPIPPAPVVPSLVTPVPLPTPNGTIPQPPPTGPQPTGPQPTGPVPVPTGPEPTGEPTNVPQPPPSSPTEPAPVPTAGAAIVLPGAFLAGLGMVAAYLI